MTANAQANTAGSQRYLITPGNVAGSQWGLYTPIGPTGSMSPGLGYKGKLWESLYSDPAGFVDLYMTFDSGITTLPGLFSGLIVVDTAGTTRYYPRSAASISAGSVRWGNGSSPVYTNATQRQVIILF